MATPWRSSFIVLGGLHGGTLGIECTDFDDVFTDPEKRGGPRPIPQQPGRSARPLTGDAVDAVLEWQLRGDFTVDNDPVVGHGQRVAQFYRHLAALRAVTGDGGVQQMDVTLADGVTVSGVDVQVTDGGRLVRPPGSEWSGKVVVTVTMLDGTVDLEGLFDGGEGEGG